MNPFSSVTSAFTNPTNLVMLASGPAGWSALAAKTLMSSFGQGVIQQLGQQLGLPQSMIDAAQSEFSLAMGDFQGAAQNAFEAGAGFAQDLGGSVTDQADFGNQLNDSMMQTAASIAGGSEEMQEAKSGGGKGGVGGSWLMAMARALGQKADQLADQMQDLADKMSSSKSDPSASLEFSAKSQEFGLFMNAASNALKTAGESLTTAARKQ
jgi:hypothetical protein